MLNFFKKSPAVQLIFYINVLVFVLFNLILGIDADFVSNFYLLNWSNENFNYFQLISYQFLHGDLIHILFNMATLLSIGSWVERYLGYKRFIFYYLLCGVGSGLGNMWFKPDDLILVGASGAIWGFLIIFVFIKPRLKLNFLEARVIIPLCLVIEILFMLIENDSKISHIGHICGALSGFIIYFLDKIYQKYLVTE